MTAPNMTTITASIERSLQLCSLNHHQSSSHSNTSADIGRSSSSDSTENHDLPNNTLELNSEIRLPYCWEQCLDLKTGEVYYINWRTGMKSQEDPRTNPEMSDAGVLCSEEEEDDSSYDNEGSSTESSPSSSREQQQQCSQYNLPLPRDSCSGNIDKPTQVLVVAGCKSCFMYFMVPKQVKDCPKCCGELLHFDHSENGFP